MWFFLGAKWKVSSRVFFKNVRINWAKPDSRAYLDSGQKIISLEQLTNIYHFAGQFRVEVALDKACTVVHVQNWSILSPRTHCTPDDNLCWNSEYKQQFLVELFGVSLC